VGVLAAEKKTTSAKRSCRDGSLRSGHRCVPAKDTLVPYSFLVKFLDGDIVPGIPGAGELSRGASISKADMSKALENHRGGFSKPGAPGLPAATEILKIEITADTSDAPPGAKSVRCALTGIDALLDDWEDSVTGEGMHSHTSALRARRPQRLLDLAVPSMCMLVVSSYLTCCCLSAPLCKPQTVAGWLHTSA
jgi:hypothetical protein